ncbi:Hypothetical predicted protein [Lecanosticta acicola]|uniref:Uncharacterized protein n=1 Tax=Lecanosticta acicola TaxID=111012 RepID=A0AAI8Z2P1_9PEZI|nr:Hypothetical predicted protein [Lecanosticta acicola]
MPREKPFRVDPCIGSAEWDKKYLLVQLAIARREGHFVQPAKLGWQAFGERYDEHCAVRIDCSIFVTQGRLGSFRKRDDRGAHIVDRLDAGAEKRDTLGGDEDRGIPLCMCENKASNEDQAPPEPERQSSTEESTPEASDDEHHSSQDEAVGPSAPMLPTPTAGKSSNTRLEPSLEANTQVSVDQVREPRYHQPTLRSSRTVRSSFISRNELPRSEYNTLLAVARSNDLNETNDSVADLKFESLMHALSGVEDSPAVAPHLYRRWSSSQEKPERYICPKNWRDCH